MNISKNRFVAFSDGIMAIIITIMALNIPLPKEIEWSQITTLLYAIMIFFISFIVIGDQWDKHHRLFNACNTISAKTIWRNILYLFFLSLLPLFTQWMMQNPREVIPAIAYDLVFMAVNITFHFIQSGIIHEDGESKKTFTEIKKRRRELRRGWVIYSCMLLFIITIFLLSFRYPTFSIIFFLGLPVITSLFNLWYTRDDMARKSRKRKIMLHA